MTGHTLSFSTCRCSLFRLCVLLAMTCMMLAGGSSELLLTSDDENSANHHDPMMGRFDAWMTVHNRSYSTVDEKYHRYEVYSTNMRYIEAVNGMAATYGLTYQLGEGPFTDRSNQEFMAHYTGPTARGDHGEEGEVDEKIITTVYANFSMSAPRSVDWRERGAVTPVKDQGNCGSCWAFSAVAATEGIDKIKRGILVSLSEQQLVDCDFGNRGCDGGVVRRAFRWIETNGGITTASSYRYKAAKGVCMSNRKPAAKIIGSSRVEMNSEVSLMNAVANQPVAVSISVHGSFQHYKWGIYNGPCGDTKLNHAVTVVGYGQQNENGAGYWIVKNSWGATWGQEGYMLMKMGTNNPSGQCGIAMYPFFPLMEGGRSTA